MKPLTELIGIQRLMALSIKEPYGSLILYHGKKETRTWATNYKGYVLLCASKSPYQAQSILEISGPEQTKRICDALGTSDLNKLNRFNGHAFAVALLAGCRPNNAKLYTSWRMDTSLEKRRCGKPSSPH